MCLKWKVPALLQGTLGATLNSVQNKTLKSQSCDETGLSVLLLFCILFVLNCVSHVQYMHNYGFLSASTKMDELACTVAQMSSWVGV